jgi:hypothetical protein
LKVQLGHLAAGGARHVGHGERNGDVGVRPLHGEAGKVEGGVAQPVAKWEERLHVGRLALVCRVRVWGEGGIA